MGLRIQIRTGYQDPDPAQENLNESHWKKKVTKFHDCSCPTFTSLFPFPATLYLAVSWCLIELLARFVPLNLFPGLSLASRRWRVERAKVLKCWRFFLGDLRNRGLDPDPDSPKIPDPNTYPNPDLWSGRKPNGDTRALNAATYGLEYHRRPRIKGIPKIDVLQNLYTKSQPHCGSELYKPRNILSSWLRALGLFFGTWRFCHSQNRIIFQKRMKSIWLLLHYHNWGYTFSSETVTSFIRLPGKASSFCIVVTL